MTAQTTQYFAGRFIDKYTAADHSSLGSLLRRNATERPHSLAIADSSRSASHQELEAVAQRVSAGLLALVAPGARVGLGLGDPYNSCRALLGVMHAHVAVPINPTMRAHDVAQLIARASLGIVLVDGLTPVKLLRALSNSKAVIVNADQLFRPQVRSAVASEADLTAIALVLPTSGTTGQPKLVSYTQAVMLAGAEASSFAYELGPSDIRLNLMPLHHVQGIVGSLLAALAAGGAMITRPFIPSRVATFADEVAATWLSATPAMHRAILDSSARATTRRLRFVRVGSAALDDTLRARLEGFWQVPIIESYGMTEAHQIASTPLTGRPHGQEGVGPPMGVDIAVTATATYGDQLWVRGPVVATHVDDGEIVADRDAVRTLNERQLLIDGWRPTGDLGRVTAAGMIVVEGRIKELIDVGGEKVSPREVEEVLRNHPDVDDVAVFGVPDYRYGQVVAALVVLTNPDEYAQKSLRAYVLDRLAPVKCPDRFAFVEAIPLGSSGKLQRAMLAQTLLSTESE